MAGTSLPRLFLGHDRTHSAALRRLMVARFLREANLQSGRADGEVEPDFFDAYRWRLGDGPPAGDGEVTPDVLGALVERHADRKATGTYYTAADVTGYIARAAVVPFLFDADDAVTGNRDMLRLGVDALERSTPETLAAFWRSLKNLKILDPTCGAGAFLLAAAAVLEPLYDACLRRRSRLGGSDPRLFVRRAIIENNLYGVDLDPDAIEVCRDRLLLWAAARAKTAADLAGIRFHVRPGDVLAEGDVFGDVRKRGGFDVVLGNPPYVERDVPGGREYVTAGCGNLYAFVVERALGLLGPRGRLGMIVPHSAFCTDRMAPLQRLVRTGRTVWVSTYDIRPSKLFAGVDQRLAICLTAPGPAARVYATRYHRWRDDERPRLFSRLRYADVSRIDYPNAIPKIGSEIELTIWDKLRRRAPLLPGLGGPVTVYYHNAPRYWVRALTFAPYFRNDRDGEKLSAQMRALAVRDRADAAAVVAALNSSLFYWWFVAFSDSRHLNRREIDRFPLGLAALRAAHGRRLSALCGRLMADYRRHAVRKTCRYKTTGRVVYDEFHPRYSKAILDDIDAVLAGHFGFTGEELDFLINYDIEYRVGPDAADG